MADNELVIFKLIAVVLFDKKSLLEQNIQSKFFFNDLNSNLNSEKLYLMQQLECSTFHNVITKRLNELRQSKNLKSGN